MALIKKIIIVHDTIFWMTKNKKKISSLNSPLEMLSHHTDSLFDLELAINICKYGY